MKQSRRINPMKPYRGKPKRRKTPESKEKKRVGEFLELMQSKEIRNRFTIEEQKQIMKLKEDRQKLNQIKYTVDVMDDHHYPCPEIDRQENRKIEKIAAMKHFVNKAKRKEEQNERENTSAEVKTRHRKNKVRNKKETATVEINENLTANASQSFDKQSEEKTKSRKQESHYFIPRDQDKTVRETSTLEDSSQTSNTNESTEESSKAHCEKHLKEESDKKKRSAFIYNFPIILVLMTLAMVVVATGMPFGFNLSFVMKVFEDYANQTHDFLGSIQNTLTNNVSLLLVQITELGECMSSFKETAMHQTTSALQRLSTTLGHKEVIKRFLFHGKRLLPAYCFVAFAPLRVVIDILTVNAIVFVENLMSSTFRVMNFDYVLDKAKILYKKVVGKIYNIYFKAKYTRKESKSMNVHLNANPNTMQMFSRFAERIQNEIRSKVYQARSTFRSSVKQIKTTLSIKNQNVKMTAKQMVFKARMARYQSGLFAQNIRQGAPAIFSNMLWQLNQNKFYQVVVSTISNFIQKLIQNVSIASRKLYETELYILKTLGNSPSFLAHAWSSAEMRIQNFIDAAKSTFEKFVQQYSF